jgi:hypothetical protein
MQGKRYDIVYTGRLSGIDERRNVYQYRDTLTGDIYYPVVKNPQWQYFIAGLLQGILSVSSVIIHERSPGKRRFYSKCENLADMPRLNFSQIETQRRILDLIFFDDDRYFPDHNMRLAVPGQWLPHLMRLSGRFKKAVAFYDYQFARRPMDYNFDPEFIIPYLKLPDPDYFREKTGLLKTRLEGENGLDLIKSLYQEAAYNACDPEQNDPHFNIGPEELQNAILQRIDVVLRSLRALETSRAIMGNMKNTAFPLCLSGCYGF